jgi:hypothetical protein
MDRPNWLRWIKECQNDPSTRAKIPPLGMLTGQDHRALDAIAACWCLYASGDAAGERAALEAVRTLLSAMQPQCWPFARELIAWALDWPDREVLWLQVQPTEEPHR